MPGRYAYTPAQRSEAVAAVQATATLESAHDLLAEVWEGRSPSLKTLWRWANTDGIEADTEFLERIEGNRKRLRDGKLHGLFDKTADKLNAELDHLEPGGSWRGVKDGAIAMGIFRDKLDPPMRSVAAMSVNSGGAPVQFNMLFGPKEEDNAIEGGSA